jgi:hypothetical protein
MKYPSRRSLGNARRSSLGKFRCSFPRLYHSAHESTRSCSPSDRASQTRGTTAKALRYHRNDRIDRIGTRGKRAPLSGCRTVAANLTATHRPQGTAKVTFDSLALSMCGGHGATSSSRDDFDAEALAFPISRGSQLARERVMHSLHAHWRYPWTRTWWLSISVRGTRLSLVGLRLRQP